MPKLPGEQSDVAPPVGTYPGYRGPFERSLGAIAGLTQLSGNMAAQMFDDDGRRKKQLALNQFSEELNQYNEQLDADKSQVDGLTEDFEKHFGDRVNEIGSSIDHKNHQFDFESRARGMYEQVRHGVFSEQLQRQRGRAETEFKVSSAEILKQATTTGTPGAYADAFVQLEHLIEDHEIAQWFGPDQAKLVRIEEFNKLEMGIAEHLLHTEQFTTLDSLVNEKDEGAYSGFRHIDEKQRAALREASKRGRQGKTADLMQMDIIINPLNWTADDVIKAVDSEEIPESAGAPLMNQIQVARKKMFEEVSTSLTYGRIMTGAQGYGGSKDEQKALNWGYETLFDSVPDQQNYTARINWVRKADGFVPQRMKTTVISDINGNDPERKHGAINFMAAAQHIPGASGALTSGDPSGQAALNLANKVVEQIDSGASYEDALPRAQQLLALDKKYETPEEYNAAFDRYAIDNGIEDGASGIWNLFDDTKGDLKLQFKDDSYESNVHKMFDEMDDGWVDPGLKIRVDDRFRDIYMATLSAGQQNIDAKYIMEQAVREVLHVYGPSTLLTSERALKQPWFGGSNEPEFVMTENPPENFLPEGLRGRDVWVPENIRDIIEREIVTKAAFAEEYAKWEPTFKEQVASYRAAHGTLESPWGPFKRKLRSTSKDNWPMVFSDMWEAWKLEKGAEVYATLDIGDPQRRAGYRLLANWLIPHRFAEGTWNMLSGLIKADGKPKDIQQYLDEAWPGGDYETPLIYDYDLFPHPTAGPGKYGMHLIQSESYKEVILDEYGDVLVVELDINDNPTEVRLAAEQRVRDERPYQQQLMYDRELFFLSGDEISKRAPGFLEHAAQDPILGPEFYSIRQMISQGTTAPTEPYATTGPANVGRHMTPNANLQRFEVDRLHRQAAENPDRSEPIYPPDLDPYEATSSRVDVKGDVPTESVRNLDATMIEPIMTVADIAAELGWPTPLITAAQRDTNPETGEPDLQFHRMGLAVDFRTAHLDDYQRERLYKELRKRLPAAFGLDWRDHGTGPHLHVEYDTPETKAAMMLLENVGG